jgi:hypothetical protein
MPTGKENKMRKTKKAARAAVHSAVEAELIRLQEEGVTANPFTQEGNFGASLCWSRGCQEARSFGLTEKQIQRVLRDAHALTKEVYYLQM